MSGRQFSTPLLDVRATVARKVAAATVPSSIPEEHYPLFRNHIETTPEETDLFIGPRVGVSA